MSEEAEVEHTVCMIAVSEWQVCLVRRQEICLLCSHKVLWIDCADRGAYKCSDP